MSRNDPPSQTPPVLEVEGVSLVRRGRKILDEVSLCIQQPGQVWGILGANGAGKTCLLKVITGLMRANSGVVRVQGEVLPPGVMPSRVGALIEEPRFYPWLTGRDNLLVFAGGDNVKSARVDELLSLVGLRERANDKVRIYSQGMRQRLGIARALLSDPALVLLDEPANGLDPEGIAWLRALVAALRSKGTTVVITSHVLSEVQRTCDTVVVMSAGRIFAEGPMASVLSGVSSLEELYFRLAERWTAPDATGSFHG